MFEVEKTIAFIVDGQPVANIGVDGKLVVPAEQPISVVHVEQRVEDAKFDLGAVTTITAQWYKVWWVDLEKSFKRCYPTN